MTAKKKTFKDSPALQFISGAGENAPSTDDTPTTPDTPTAPAPTGKENHNRRLNLSLQPSVVADIQKVAFMEHTTVNALTNKLLKAYAAERREKIDRYDQIFREENTDE